MIDFSRREFLATVATAAVVAGLDQSTRADTPQTPPTSPARPITLRWLDSKPQTSDGITLTVPWPSGKLSPKESLAISSDTDQPIPADTWPLAYWPDGSIKWTAHAIPPMTTPAGAFTIMPGKPTPPITALQIHQTPQAIEIDTGIIRCRVPRTGPPSSNLSPASPASRSLTPNSSASGKTSPLPNPMAVSPPNPSPAKHPAPRSKTPAPFGPSSKWKARIKIPTVDRCCRSLCDSTFSRVPIRYASSTHSFTMLMSKRISSAVSVSASTFPCPMPCTIAMFAWPVKIPAFSPKPSAP